MNRGAGCARDDAMSRPHCGVMPVARSARLSLVPEPAGASRAVPFARRKRCAGEPHDAVRCAPPARRARGPDPDHGQGARATALRAAARKLEGRRCSSDYGLAVGPQEFIDGLGSMPIARSMRATARSWGITASVSKMPGEAELPVIAIRTG